MKIILGILAALFAPLLEEEAGHWMRKLNAKLIRVSTARIADPELRARYLEEWSSHSDELPPLSGLLHALDCFRGVTKISISAAISNAKSSQVVIKCEPHEMEVLLRTGYWLFFHTVIVTCGFVARGIHDYRHGEMSVNLSWIWLVLSISLVLCSIGTWICRDLAYVRIRETVRHVRLK